MEGSKINKMIDKQNISIGIPAYNEEENIRHLISMLLSQDSKKAKINEIIVVSDGSTDNTSKIIKNIENKKIFFIENKKRFGLAKVQNQIIKKFSGEILILLNADVLPKTTNFIQEIVEPFLSDSAVKLVGPKLIPAKSINFFEKVINYSVEFKDSMASKWKDGDNLYLCRGGARAFERSFAKEIIWKDSLSEDAYSYLLCVNKGYKFRYHPKSEVLFKSPDNFKDHVSQSARFAGGQSVMNRYFDKNFVKKEYSIPRKYILQSMVVYFIKNPILFSSYTFILVYIKFATDQKNYVKSNWIQSKSSKKIK